MSFQSLTLLLAPWITVTYHHARTCTHARKLTHGFGSRQAAENPVDKDPRFRAVYNIGIAETPDVSGESETLGLLPKNTSFTLLARVR